ncbi:MAG: hypothetical protein ACE5FD_12240, partial [Anaerolineae bacterium]
LFMSLSNLFIIADLVRVTAVAQPDPLFRLNVELTAVRWLRDNVPLQTVILSAYQSGNFIASHGGQRVIIGHWVETSDFERKQNEVAQFFDAATPDQWRLDYLEKNRITLIWYGPREQELGDFDPANATYLFPWQAFEENGEVIRLYLVQ